jgi:integrase
MAHTAETTKMRREHPVPLSKQATEVLMEMKELFGNKPNVFTSMMSGKKLSQRIP